MSKRYNLTLRNKKTGRECNLQLFGNNDWFQSFVPFLKQHGAKIDPYEPYIPDDEAIIITDLIEFVKAIDETVWSIIKENPVYEYKNQFGQTEETSDITDFTRSFFLQDSNKNMIVSNTIYMQASLIVEGAYVFSSYNMINWLNNHNAIINKSLRWTNHNYTNYSGRNDIIIIGELHPDFELRLSYW